MTKAQRIYEKAGCLLMAALMLLTACRDSHEEETEEYRTMPVTLQIPADGVAKRSPGDPGEGTLLPKPTFVYLYLYTKDGSGTGTVTHVRLDNIPEELWELTGAESSTPMYRYRGGIRIDVPLYAQKGRLYGAAATTDIAPHYTPGTITTEKALQDMTFTVEPKGGSYAWLRDVYSSPADLPDTKVNGTVWDIGTAVPYTTLVLYHTAAKVDFTWNVNPDDAQGRTLYSIDVTARGGTVRLFRPTPASLTGSTPYTQPVITHDAIHPGNRNYGRADTYVIQPAEGTLNWTLSTTDGTGTPTKYPGNDKPKDEVGTVYSVWYRVNARVGY